MCTSTLAIGINLPAHLVIIKSTKFYETTESYKEYSISQIQQMIGRAGRPQFDKSAVAVIMTTSQEQVGQAGHLKKTILLSSKLLLSS